MGSNVSAMADGATVMDLFQTIDRGDFVTELEEKLRQVVQATVENGGKGKVSIVLDFDYDHQTEAMKVANKITAKIPEQTKRASLFYVTGDCMLSRYDDRQREMFARDGVIDQPIKVVAPQVPYQDRQSTPIDVEPEEETSGAISSDDLHRPITPTIDTENETVDPLTGEVINTTNGVY